MNKICVQKAAILSLAAILDFGTETEMVPNLDVFRIQRPTSVPIFTDFSQFEQLLGIVSPICSTKRTTCTIFQWGISLFSHW